MNFWFYSLLVAVVSCDTHDSAIEFVSENRSSDEANPIEGIFVTTLPASGEVISDSWAFDVELQGNEGQTVDYEKNEQSMSVTMVYDVKNSGPRRFNQKDRRETAEFTQEGKTATGDKAYQLSPTTYERKLDILLVVDTSDSMKTEREGLGDRLLGLLAQVEDSDWRIAITTTDRGQSLKPDWILTKGDPGVAVKFNTIVTERVLTDITTIDIEMPILMAVNALGGDLTPSIYSNSNYPLGKSDGSWIRPGSSIAVIIVTDELNLGYPYVPGKCYISYSYSYVNDKYKYYHNSDACAAHVAPVTLYDYLQNDLGRKPRDTFEIHGILSQASQLGYEDIINDSGGHLGVGNVEERDGSVNEAGYNNVINEISISTYQILANKISIPAAIHSREDFNFTGISVNDQTIEAGTYTYDSSAQTITFKAGSVPKKNYKIKVHYSYTSVPFRDSFDLNHTPLARSVKRTSFTNCGGWTDQSFRLSGNRVTFNSSPPAGCKVTFEYKRNEPLHQGVRLREPGYKIYAITIGNSDVTTHFDQSSGYLNLAPVSQLIPQDGGKLTVNYKYRKKILRYPVQRAAGLTDPKEVTCTDIGGNQIACRYESGHVIFAETNFRVNKPVLVKQPLASTASITSFSLKSGYQADTVSLTITDKRGNTSTCSGNDLDIQDDKIMLTTAKAKNTCSALVSNTLSTVTLNPYKFLEQREFRIDDNHFFTYHQHRSESWEVAIDGNKLDESEYDLDLETRTVTLKTQPAAGSKVEINVTLNL